jgi:CheY-like chemotaxis protein/tetratricopeptide (TPR) repeat protein
MALKVLIIEDNPEERRALVALFERHPAFSVFETELLEAIDGQEGLERFVADTPDLLVVDLLLPKVDGLSLCRQVRAQEGGDQVAIIACSGVYRDVRVKRDLAAEGVPLLPKPLDQRVFVQHVLHQLEGRRRALPDQAKSWQSEGKAIKRKTSRAVIGGSVAEQRASTPEQIGSSGTPAPSPAEGSPDSATSSSPDSASAPQAASGSGGLQRVSTSVDSEALSFDGPLRGRLDAIPLAAVLVRAMDQKATGTLRLTRGRVRKAIFMKVGRPIFVDSNLRNETLGAYLIAQKKIDEAQLTTAMKEARANKKKLGEALVGLGIVDQATVMTGLRAQTGIKIVSALRWPDGAFAFAPGDDFSGRVPDCGVDVVPLLLTAQARFVRVDELSARLEPKLDNHLLRLTAPGKRLLPSIIKAFGSQLIGPSFEQALLRQVISAAPDAAKAMAQIEALLVSELVLLHEVSVDAPISASQPSEAATERASRDPAPSSPGTLQGIPPADSAPIPAPAAAAPPPVPTFASLQAVDAEAKAGAQPRESDSPGLPRFDLGSLQPIELDDPGGSSPETAGLGLKDLAPAESDNGASPIVDLELEQPTTDPPRWLDPDSGVMEIPQTEGIELEEPDASKSLELEEPEVPSTPAPELLDSTGPKLPRSTSARPKGASENRELKRAMKALDGDIAALRERSQAVKLTPTGADADGGARHSSGIDGALAQAPGGGPLDPLRQHDYEQRLASAQPQQATKIDSFGAELYFQEGQGLLRANDFAGATRAFQQAVDANPEQPEYHGFLGWSLFQQRGRGVAGALAARPHMDRAFQISPDTAHVHELAGRIEEDARELDPAIDHLSKALRLGPPRMDLFASVKDLLLRTGDMQRLERHYRNMILRLRERDPQRSLPLWIDLAYLYHEKLAQPQNAQLALDVASQLAPSDPKVQAARAYIESASVPWEQVAEGHRQRLAATPDDPTPLHELFRLHHSGNRVDHLRTVAEILIAKDVATAEERQIVSALLDRPTARCALPLSNELTSALRHATDDEHTEQVLADLAPVLAGLIPIDARRLGIDLGTRLAPEHLPGAWPEALRYASEQLRVNLPALYVSTVRDGMAPLPGGVSGVVVGSGLLEQRDVQQLVFCATRAFSCLVPGRREVFVRRGSDLKTAFLAAVTAHRPDVKIPDPDGLIAAFRDRLRGDAARAERVRGRLEQLFGSGGGQLNLSEWMRGVKKTGR